jgi:hypothetical protein
MCNFVVPDVGVANFTLDFPQRDGIHFNRLRIMDVFAKREGHWIQTASYTVTDPAWKAQQMAQPTTLSVQAKKQLLDFREGVWRAWFAGDTATLATMIPDEIIAVNNANPDFDDHQKIMDGSKSFAAGGAKLTRLEFPRTDIQAYGNTIILFTTYSYDISDAGKKTTVTGNGVETFVRRDGKLLNTGWILSNK